jgi:hypothetical protein
MSMAKTLFKRCIQVICASGLSLVSSVGSLRHDALMAAGVALDPQKAVFEQATLQVVVELLRDERGE